MPLSFRCRSPRRAWLALCLAFSSGYAEAAVTQPDGTVMPREGNQSEVSLQELFDFKEGPGVMDAVADADIAPATFRPLCDFTAQLLLHETGDKSSLGWYNVRADAVAPTTVCNDPESDDCTPDDIFVIIPGTVTEPPYGRAADPLNNPGQVFTGADIAASKYYAGGEIGFALLTPQRHYSETRLNPVCTDATKCAEGEHWIPTIVYKSKSMPQSYYMCAEDQEVGKNGEWGNNDGDFNDYVILFTGLVCSGSGEACDTGEPGICAAGITDCADANGESACKRIHAPGEETCNAIDDDCDGEVDEGDLCAEGEICDRGRCVPTCLTGEFPCSAGFVCNKAGACVEAACADVECDEGEICQGGKCKGACDDIVCPHDQSCFKGACIDPCEGVECGEGLVCNGGACLVSCACLGCENGVCDPESGLCVDEGCVGKECPEGTHCAAGKCVDDCKGTVCPGGAECVAGACMAPISNEGGSGNDDDDAVIVVPGNGGTGGSRGGTRGGRSGDDDASDGGALGSSNSKNDPSSGCGCRTPGRAVAQGSAISLLFALALTLRRRSRGERELRRP